MAMLKNYRHERFAQAIFKGMNQTQATIEAGYSMSRARFTGRDLATYSHIIERIKELNEATESSTIASVKERKEVLTQVIRGRFTHFMDESGNLIQLTKENVESAALQEVKITQFVGGKDGRAKENTTTIKLHSPLQAIDLLNKMEGEYPPANVLKVEVEPGKDFGKILGDLLGRLRGYKKE